MSQISIHTVDKLLKQARFRDSFKVLPKGKTYRDLSTIIIIPTPGNVAENGHLNCKKCKTVNEYTKTNVNGLNPVVVESWKKLIKPMNVPILEMMVNGHEVGQAYNVAIEAILTNPGLKKFKYILTLEHDNIIPYMPNTQGPLMTLYNDIEKGYDAVGGLYWTKGNPSMPLIYGDPREIRGIKKKNEQAGMFKVRFPAKVQKKVRVGTVNKDGHDWHDGELVECNGMGMGFTLFKLDLFRDERFIKPWFKTAQEHTNDGMKMYTQDLYFFENFRKLGYKCAMDTRIKLGHIDLASGIIY